MVPDVFLFRLVASFAAGFAIVALVTTMADLSGEGPAGFVGGLPSTGAVGLLSIGLTQSTSAATQATTLFPLGFSVTFAFLLFYTIPKKSQFRIRMTVAIALWFLSALAVAIWGPSDFTISLLLSIFLSLGVLFARSKVVTSSPKRIPVRIGWTLTFLRGVLGGTVVATVVILSAVGGPLAGGVFAAAPAIWSSSLYVTARTQGVEFSRSLTMSFMRTGMLTIIPFTVAVRYFFSTSGIWLGTALAYLVITPLAYLAWRLSKRNHGETVK
jgi:hypothetical protein